MKVLFFEKGQVGLTNHFESLTDLPRFNITIFFTTTRPSLPKEGALTFFGAKKEAKKHPPLQT